MKRILVVILLAIATCTVIVGCGDKTDNTAVDVPEWTAQDAKGVV